MRKTFIFIIAVILFSFSFIASADNVTEQINLEVEEQIVVVQPEMTRQERLEQLASRGEVRYMYAEVTAYTASADECGKDDGITASGEEIYEGVVAAAPSFPFGTILYIEDLGEVVVLDRGGAITEGKIDVYVPTKSEAFEFGRQMKKVYILRLGG